MRSNNFLQQTAAAVGSSLLAVIVASTLAVQPAAAHHPFGGTMPTTFVEGLLSGLGHPVIGLDHLAFTIAIGAIAFGRIAVDSSKGWGVSAAFLAAAVGGTLIHLQEWSLPSAELAISASVLLLGILLLTQRSYQWVTLAAIAACAGIFHGYAYGEAVVGAEPTPILAYLMGFTAIQGALAYASGWLLQRAQTFPAAVALGGLISGIGVTFLSELLLA
ncbi:MAG: HupE/UreJ family protein [Synechococcus sp.]